MSHPSYKGDIGHPFIELFTIDSTNNYAMAQSHEGLAKHGTVYITKHQTAGKGQRNKRWDAEPGENITMSCVLEPEGPNTAWPFLLSIAVALACRDLFEHYSQGETTIKWPNDIYWRDRKAGGILIENIYRAGDWQFAIAGTGLNINQTSFPPELPNPVSLKQVTGKEHDRILLAKELCSRLDERYRQFLKADTLLLEEYNQHLYKKDEVVRLKKENMIFQARVTGVSPAGELIVHDSIERRFGFGEVEWIM
ncbi:MAG TPA: biotin--[acetyl-CoA-carboxylase] ligase [Chitinophagaceae bacterium]